MYRTHRDPAAGILAGLVELAAFLFLIAATCAALYLSADAFEDGSRDLGPFGWFCPPGELCDDTTR